MDQTQLTELARQVLTYLGPLIAAGALAKVGEDTLDQAKLLAQRTWALFQHRFQGNDEAQAALTLFKAKPEDAGRKQIVEGEIVTDFARQPDAVAELQALVAEARQLNLLPQQVAGRIHNQHIGDDAQVGVAVAGDVHGGINVPVQHAKRPKA